jgi:hypothetical protein
MKQYICKVCRNSCTLTTPDCDFPPECCPFDSRSNSIWVELGDEIVHKVGEEKVTKVFLGMTSEQVESVRMLTDIITHMYEKGYTVFGKSAYIEERLSRVRKMFKEEKE